VIQFYDVDGLVPAETIDDDGVRSYAGNAPWYHYGFTADPAEGGAVHQALGPWPKTADFDALTTGTAIIYSDGLTATTGADARAWSDVAMLDSTTLVALSTQGNDAIYKVELIDPTSAGAVGTASTSLLFSAPEDFAEWHRGRLDSWYELPAPLHPGDANGDDKVDVFDLAALANHYGLAGDWNWEDGDFDDNDTVNVFDLAILANNYGYDGTGGQQSTIPEPACLAILALGLPALLRRRRRA
jgi:MYXO-CTERM domain-containing protein